MFFLIEHVIAIVIALLIVVGVATALMVGTAIERRQVRDRYFRRLDDLREKFGPIISGVLDGRVEYAQGVQALQGLGGRDRLLMLERLCLEKRTTPEQLPVLRRLCEDLGLVEVWHKLLSGERKDPEARRRLADANGFFLYRLGRLDFLVRAKCAENLGVIRHHPSWPLLVKALEDPHPDVRAVAVHALALLGEPQSFPALLTRLHGVVTEPQTVLSLRAVKTAVVSFPLETASQLLPSLQHQHRRVRYLATDVIREMVEREAVGKDGFVLSPALFPAPLSEAFLNLLPLDSNSDVRARAAPVIAYLEGTRPIAVLLNLLEDKEWFVRLHTVRALAKARFTRQVDEIARRLTDTHWMVREAAVHALVYLGQLERLYDDFLRTPDRYSQEQIADEWQRAGVIPVLLQRYAHATGGGQEMQVLGRLVQMNKTSYMLATLEIRGERGLRRKFVHDFGRSPDPQIQLWVRGLAESSADEELRSLARSLLPPRG